MNTALEQLVAGNGRYVAGTPDYPNRSVDRRNSLTGGQQRVQAGGDNVRQIINDLEKQYPGLKEHSAGIVTEKSQVFGPTSLLYVSQREFAVTHSHDSKVQVLGSDDVTTNLLIIIRHTGSGTLGLAQVDGVCEEGLTTYIQRVTSLSYGYEGRIELHLLGAFSDSKGLGAKQATERKVLAKGAGAGGRRSSEPPP